MANQFTPQQIDRFLTRLKEFAKTGDQNGLELWNAIVSQEMSQSSRSSDQVRSHVFREIHRIDGLWLLTVQSTADGSLFGQLVARDGSKASLRLLPEGRKFLLQTDGLPAGSKLSSIGTISVPSKPSRLTCSIMPPDSWVASNIPPLDFQDTVSGSTHEFALGGGSEVFTSTAHFGSGKGALHARFGEHDKFGRIIAMQVVCASEWSGLYVMEAIAGSWSASALIWLTLGGELSEDCRILAEEIRLKQSSQGEALLLVDDEAVIPLDLPITIRPLTRSELEEIAWRNPDSVELRAIEVTPIDYRADHPASLSAEQVARIFTSTSDSQTVHYIELSRNKVDD